MPDQEKYMNLLGLYRRLANGEQEVALEIVQIESELGLRHASPAPDIENRNRHIRALERENALLSISWGGIFRCKQ